MGTVNCPICYSLNLSGPSYLTLTDQRQEAGVTIFDRDNKMIHHGMAEIREFNGFCVFGHGISRIEVTPVELSKPVPRPSNLYTVIDGFAMAAEDYSRRAVERKFRTPKPTFILED